MVLAPLATAADLPDKWSGSAKADRALAVASSAIRDAAGCPISATTATVTVDPPRGVVLTLPGPITDVASVLIDGEEITDYRPLSNGVWRRCGWYSSNEPAPVTITYTFGLALVPEDIVDLCANLAGAWLTHDAEGGGSTAGIAAAAIDDAREQYTAEASGQVSPVFIPEATRNWLRARFSGGVVVVDAS